MMKLIEIKDVRIGQIRKRYDGVIFVIEKKEDENVYGLEVQPNQEVLRYSVMPKYKESAMKRCELIGFIGITHEFINNKLVEIPGKTKDKTIYFINDVVKYQDCEGNTLSAVINQKEVSPLYNYYIATNTLGCFVEISDNLEDQEGLEPYEYTYYPMEKIGILGVTHEFANERLVK